jgi:hypothetical protein
MKRSLTIVLLISFSGLTTIAKGASPFVGTWEAKLNDQPAVELRIEEAGEKIAGIITFFFQRRGADDKWHVEGKPTRRPVIAPQVDGNFLTFEVLHHKHHGGPELGPNKRYRMELTGKEEMFFRNVEGLKEDPTDLRLTRRK